MVNIHLFEKYDAHPARQIEGRLIPKENKTSEYIERKIDLPEVPAIGAQFNFMDEITPELDHIRKVASVEYVVVNSKPKMGSERNSKLDRINVYLE